MKLAQILAASGLSLLAMGCNPPVNDVTTDLFLVDIWTDSGLIRVGDPDNLTERRGYDSQPSWSADGRSIYYASRTGDASDVYRYDLESDETVRVTRTEDREYSPQEVPSGGGITAVRLERNSSMRIWRYDADGQNPTPLLPAFRDMVRYYEWIDDLTVALGVGDDASELNIASLDTGEVEPVGDNVGRSLNRVPGKRALSFVLKETPADWWVAELDLEARSVTRLVRTLQGVEDHAWMPSGELLMGKGSRLYVFIPGGNGTWEEIADFSNSEMVAISRIAVNPQGDRVVIASEVR